MARLGVKSVLLLAVEIFLHLIPSYFFFFFFSFSLFTYDEAWIFVCIRLFDSFASNLNHDG